MSGKKWIIFGAMCVLLLGGLIWLSRSESTNVDNVDVNVVQAASSENGDIADRVLGAETDGKVVIIEYGDYQCPGCATAAPVIKQVTERYPDDVTLVFRNMPLISIHPNALAAASAAEAAGQQGKFWEMHEYLYRNQTAWSQLSGAMRMDYFNSVATQFELDIDRFKADADSDTVKKKIDFDRALASKHNVTSTPTIYVNGENVSDQFALDGKVVPKGTKDAVQVWTDAELFDTLVVQPALEKSGR